MQFLWMFVCVFLCVVVCELYASVSGVIVFVFLHRIILCIAWVTDIYSESYRFTNHEKPNTYVTYLPITNNGRNIIIIPILFQFLIY